MPSREIEFKTLLTPAEFQAVVAHYQLTKDRQKTQTNYYFDTPKQQLKNQHWGLRIRTYADYGEQTLKVPATDGGLWEITDKLSLQEAATLTKNGTIKAPGQVATKLATIDVAPSDLHPIASLKTARWEFAIPEGLLALDESWYGSQHDFELELEVKDPLQGKEDFHTLLRSLNLNYRPGENKIARAFKEK